MKICVHTLVKNEENFLWYCVKSVIDYVDEMLLWDTGSTDKTIEIIKLLKKEYPKKIKTKFIKQTDIHHFTDIRQQMLDETKADWVILVDGDEIWWKDSIKQVVSEIKNNPSLETIVNSYYNCVGDIYHFQNENMGKYNIDDITGHVTIRAMNAKIPGLHYGLPHGQQGIFDKDNKLIQNRNKLKRIHVKETAYLHMTNLIRSSNEQDVAKRQMKFKFSKGNKFTKDFYYPEVFFLERPKIVCNIWRKRNVNYEVRASVFDLMRSVKNKLPLKEKSGY